MDKCNRCGKELVPWCGVIGCHDRVEVYSRPCGYLRPTSCWNDGKQAEFRDRREFTDIMGRKIAHMEIGVEGTHGDNK